MSFSTAAHYNFSALNYYVHRKPGAYSMVLIANLRVGAYSMKWTHLFRWTKNRSSVSGGYFLCNGILAIDISSLWQEKHNYDSSSSSVDFGALLFLVRFFDERLHSSPGGLTLVIDFASMHHWSIILTTLVRTVRVRTANYALLVYSKKECEQ
jgi:hypothetical protein